MTIDLTEQELKLLQQLVAMADTLNLVEEDVVRPLSDKLFASYNRCVWYDASWKQVNRYDLNQMKGGYIA